MKRNKLRRGKPRLTSGGEAVAEETLKPKIKTPGETTGINGSPKFD